MKMTLWGLSSNQIKETGVIRGRGAVSHARRAEIFRFLTGLQTDRKPTDRIPFQLYALAREHHFAERFPFAGFAPDANGMIAPLHFQVVELTDNRPVELPRGKPFGRTVHVLWLGAHTATIRYKNDWTGEEESCKIAPGSRAWFSGDVLTNWAVTVKSNRPEHVPVDPMVCWSCWNARPEGVADEDVECDCMSDDSADESERPLALEDDRDCMLIYSTLADLRRATKEDYVYNKHFHEFYLPEFCEDENTQMNEIEERKQALWTELRKDPAVRRKQRDCYARAFGLPRSPDTPPSEHEEEQAM